MEGINNISSYFNRCYTDACTSVENAKDRMTKAVSGAFQNVGDAFQSVTKGVTKGLQVGCFAAAKTVSDGCTDTINSVTNGCANLGKAMTDGCNSAFQSIANSCKDKAKAVVEGCNNAATFVKEEATKAVNKVAIKCLNAANAVKDFGRNAYKSMSNTATAIMMWLHSNRYNIFFGACAAASLYFAPTKTITAALIAFTFRVEISRAMKSAADEYLKPEKNPYKLNPKFDPLSILDIAAEALAGSTAAALGTYFSTTSTVVTWLPILGGIALGNVAAKAMMNWMDGNEQQPTPPATPSPKPHMKTPKVFVGHDDPPSPQASPA